MCGRWGPGGHLLFGSLKLYKILKNVICMRIQMNLINPLDPSDLPYAGFPQDFPKFHQYPNSKSYLCITIYQNEIISL